jgi:hypothetical protein
MKIRKIRITITPSIYTEDDANYVIKNFSFELFDQAIRSTEKQQTHDIMAVLVHGSESFVTRDAATNILRRNEI